jgi:hypothetical protein
MPKAKQSRGQSAVVINLIGFPSPTADKQRRLESIPPKNSPTDTKTLQITASELAYSLRGSLPNIALAKT